MNILVTGGAGFIGSHTVVALSEAGLNPVIIDDFSNSQTSVLRGLKNILKKNVKCYKKNCNDLKTLRSIFQKEKIGGVIHFAAFKAVGESQKEPLKYYENNLGSLLTLLEAMLLEGVSNLIFSSSATVYGEPETLPVTEETPMQPASSTYGSTKQIGEIMLRDTAAAGKPLKIISLRYFNPIGAHPGAQIGELPLGIPSNLVPFVTQTAAGIRPELTIFGQDYDTPDGTAVRDFIHVMDLAEAHVRAMQKLLATQSESYYNVYNLGTGRGNSVMEIVKTFEDIIGRPFPYRMGTRRSGDISAIYADVSKAERELGWVAKRSMREGLADAWRWQERLGEG